jgi:hypothetical protein
MMRALPDHLPMRTGRRFIQAPSPRVKRAASSLVIVMLVSPIAGCGLFQPRGETLEELPSLAEVKSRHPRQWSAGPNPPGSRPSAKLHIRQIALPIDRSLNDAWEQINQTAIPRATRAAWQDNGFRIGLLDQSKVAKFKQALPEVLGTRFSTLYAASHPSPMLDSPGLKSPYFARLTFQSDGGSTQRLTGGRVQMLARANQDTAGQLYVSFIPHHYKRQLSVEPRSPMAKQLDGTVFNELAIRMPAPRRKYIVLGLYRPRWPKQPEAGFKPKTVDQINEADTAKRDTDPTKNNPQAQPDNGKPSTENQNPPGDGPEPQQSQKADEPAAMPGQDNGQINNPLKLANHMGKALFTGRRIGNPRQLMLIIDVSRLRGNR